MASELNPRGIKRPRNGSGRGGGLLGFGIIGGGRGANRNTEPCPVGGPGYGLGGGLGKGKNRK